MMLQYNQLYNDIASEAQTITIIQSRVSSLKGEALYLPSN